MSQPRYPEIRLDVHSRNPLVWASEVRQALRRSGADRDEIQRFSESVFSAQDQEDMLRVCSAWANIQLVQH